MMALDVPRDGRATFHRLNVRALRDMLLVEERSGLWTSSVQEMEGRDEAVQTYLRPIAYLYRRIGT
jgi:hypothetical protein